jgi:hypothetical protein
MAIEPAKIPDGTPNADGGGKAGIGGICGEAHKKTRTLKFRTKEAP